MSTVVVDEQEYERALEDPTVHDLHVEADEYLSRLEREGRDF